MEALTWLANVFTLSPHFVGRRVSALEDCRGTNYFALAAFAGGTMLCFPSAIGLTSLRRKFGRRVGARDPEESPSSVQLEA
mmetsp:Transcript_29415/g.44452  ORF Transcript_29415/g.44452 Transcript_29415/m.44452 type:complete len:81 (+) Transcript_29415:152-394(+)